MFFLLVSFLFLSFSCPLPFFFPVLLSVSSFSFPRDVWQKTSRPRTGMRVQKQKKVANSVGIGPVFLLRADVMLPTGFNIFRVDSSISKSYFFNFGLSG